MSEKLGVRPIELEGLYDEIGCMVGRIEGVAYGDMPGREIIVDPKLRISQHARTAGGLVLERSFGYVPMIDAPVEIDPDNLEAAVHYMAALTVVVHGETRVYTLGGEAAQYYPFGSDDIPHEDDPEKPDIAAAMLHELQEMWRVMVNNPEQCTINRWVS